MEPRQLVEKWVDAFNAGNADNIAELYHLDAINHQVANEPIKGKKAIREMFAHEFNSADMTCIPENIFQDGNGPFWNGKTLWDCGAAAFLT